MNGNLRKIALAVCALGAVTLTSVTPSAVAAPQSGNDQRGIAKLREWQEDAWAKCDAVAFAATYTPDADVVTFNGYHFSTRKGIEAGMGDVFAKYCQHTRISQHDARVEFPSPTMAIIIRESCLINPGESECRAGSQSVNTNVLIKRHGSWLQRNLQNTRVEQLP